MKTWSADGQTSGTKPSISTKTVEQCRMQRFQPAHLDRVLWLRCAGLTVALNRQLDGRLSGSCHSVGRRDLKVGEVGVGGLGRGPRLIIAAKVGGEEDAVDLEVLRDAEHKVFLRKDLRVDNEWMKE